MEHRRTNAAERVGIGMAHSRGGDLDSNLSSLHSPSVPQHQPSRSRSRSRVRTLGAPTSISSIPNHDKNPQKSSIDRQSPPLPYYRPTQRLLGAPGDGGAALDRLTLGHGCCCVVGGVKAKKRQSDKAQKHTHMKSVRGRTDRTPVPTARSFTVRCCFVGSFVRGPLSCASFIPFHSVPFYLLNRFNRGISRRASRAPPSSNERRE
mgnify:CR=1 FL=1